MGDRREPSRPPSRPHPALTRGASFLGPEDRPARIQLGAALLLGLVLVASGLYLWRRPHTPSDGSASDPAWASRPRSLVAGGVAPGDAGGAIGAGFAGSVADAGAASPVALSDARILGCQD